MADQEDQVKPVYSKEDMASFEQYEKDLADYNKQAKSFKEHEASGYDLYPAAGAAIGAGIPLAGAATNKISDIASKGFDALNRQSAASAGQRWAEAVGGPGGKTVDEAVKMRELQMGLKPGERLLDGIVVDQATYDKVMAERAAQKAAQSTTQATSKINPKELDLLQRSGLLRKVLGGAATGFDLGEAYRRYKTGDTRGAVISGLGALGYPLSRIPYPPAEAAGYGLMLGAPALNQYLDNSKAKGGLARLKKAPSHFAKGGEAGVAVDALGAISDAIQEAKSMTPGYLKSTPTQPHPEVGSRFITENLGNLAEKIPFDPAKYQGSSFVMVPWDSMTRNQAIKNISGVDLTKPFVTEGGFDYPRDISHIQQKIAGASGEDIAKRIQKRFQIAQEENLRNKGTGVVLGMPSTMGLGAETFQTTPTNITLDLLKQRELPKADIESLNQLVRDYTIPQKGRLLKNFVGFTDPRLEEQLTLGGLGLETTAPELRKGIMNRFGLKGSQEKLGYNIEDLQNAILDPTLKDLPKGYMGHTVFEAYPSLELTPSKHSAFNTDFPGQYVASGISMPAEAIMPNQFNKIYIELANKFPTFHPSHIRNMTLGALEKRNAGVSQMINQQVIDNYGKYMEGLKSGAFDPNNPIDIMNYLQSPKFGKGGEVGAGLDVLSAIRDAIQEAKAAPTVNRIDMNFKDVTKRVPEITDAFAKLTNGEIGHNEYDAIVNQYKPVTPFNFIPTPATREEAINSLRSNQKDLYGIPSQTLQEGHPVGLRLDIPAYRDYGTWVPTVHEQKSGFGAGPLIGHESVAHITDPTFGMSQEAAASIAGGKPKGTIATIKGNWKPTIADEAVARAQEYLNHPDWAQVGMDPERHSYFYDRTTMEPVTHAEEALQIGPLVLAKKPKYAKKEDFKYAKGGEVEFTNKYGLPIGTDQYGNQILPQPTELDELKNMLPDRSTIQAIPKATSILGNKIAEEAKREWDKSGWRSIPDIALNTGSILGGSISDLISGFSPSLNKGEPTNPALGVGQEKEKPNFLGSEQIHDYLRQKGITKEDYPLAENALMLATPYAGEIPGMISKGVRATEGLPVGLSIKDVSPRFTSNKVQFTSPLEDALNSFPQKIESMPGDQWSAWLRNQPAGAKKEAEAIGLQDKLASKSNVSKNELLEHVKNESPKVSRRVLNNDLWIEQHPEGDFYVTDNTGDIMGERFHDYNDAIRASHKLGAQFGTEALTLPEGDRDYREILLSSPWHKSPSGLDFSQAHFPDTKNLLAHLRVNDRTSAEGKPALFLEELQSDWGQKGRKLGFDREPLPTNVSPEELVSQHYHKLDPDQKRWMNDFNNEMEMVLSNKDHPGQESAYENLMDKYGRWINNQSTKNIVPSAPYVKDTKDWSSLALKHAIKEAIENKKEQVAWTTGAQQNFRNMKESAPKGMKDFYDNIMHQSANDILKKLGAKERVRPIEFDLKDQLPPQAFGDRPEYFDPNEIIPAHRSKQWGFDISPELKQKILNEGLPKFKKGGEISKAQMRVELANQADPSLHKQFKNKALKEATHDKHAKLAIMDPKDFEKYATPISHEDKSHTKHQVKKEMHRIEKHGLKDVPHLDISNKGGNLKITGHDGRHRARAMAELHEHRMLVKLDTNQKLPKSGKVINEEGNKKVKLPKSF